MSRFALLSLTWFLFQYAIAEPISLPIKIDEVVIGEVTLDINSNEEAIGIHKNELLSIIRPYLKSDKIENIEKQGFDNKINTEFLSLIDLKRIGIDYQYNKNNLELSLFVPLQMRLYKDFPVIIRREQTGKRIASQDYSGYLNYSILGRYNSEQRTAARESYLAPYEGQLELVQSFKYFTLESTASYLEFDNVPIQRQDTSIVLDDEEQQIRYRFGDFYSGSSGFQAALPAAGIQIQKQYSIHPDKGSLTRRSTLVNIKKNALMEVYVNNILISRIRVTPGPYNLKELPIVYGQNKVRIHLLDDFGGIEEFEVDLMYDDQILAEGKFDYALQLGSPSYFVNREKSYVSDIYFSAYQRYGYSNATTLGWNLQHCKKQNVLGLSFGNISGIGTWFWDVAAFKEESVNESTAHRLKWNSFTFFEEKIPFKIIAVYETKDGGFKSLAYNSSTLPNFKRKYDLIFQKSLGVSSNLSLGVTEVLGQNSGGDDIIKRIVYQKNFLNDWIFDMSYYWSKQSAFGDQILLNLTWSEQTGRRQAAFFHDTANKSLGIRLNQNNENQYNDYRLGLNSSVQDSVTNGQTENVDASADYLGEKAEFRFRAVHASNNSEKTGSVQIGVNSAIAWSGGYVSLSRPVADAFAMVLPMGLSPNEKISVPNGFDHDGLYINSGEKFVFSNLNSYIDSRLQLDATSLNQGRFLERESYVVKPRYRSGVLVPLNIIQALTIKGKLVSDKPEQIQYAYGKIWSGDGRLVSSGFFTDENGRFIIDGLASGNYEIELSDPRLKRLKMYIEATTEYEVELPPIRIEQEEGT